MLNTAAKTMTIYSKYLLVKIIPTFPIFLAITLSSNEDSPNIFDDLTSLRHLAHLCTACFVRPTKNGINIILMIPKTRIPRIAKRYPRRFISYATMECETESQCGHLTFCDLFQKPK